MSPIYKCFLGLVFSFLASAIASAESLPKLDDEFGYYCAGEREFKPFNQPNALLILKLPKSQIIRTQKSAVICETDYVDEAYLLQLFINPKQKVLDDGGAAFQLPIGLDRNRFVVRVTIGYGNNYEELGVLDSFNRTKDLCGFDFSKTYPDLLHVRRASKDCDHPVDRYFSSNTHEDEFFSINCFDGQNLCGMKLFYNGWRINIQDIPEKYLNRAREIHEEIVKYFMKRVVLIYSPRGCDGEYCNFLSRALGR